MYVEHYDGAWNVWERRQLLDDSSYFDACMVTMGMIFGIHTSIFGYLDALDQAEHAPPSFMQRRRKTLTTRTRRISRQNRSRDMPWRL